MTKKKIETKTLPTEKIDEPEPEAEPTPTPKPEDTLTIISDLPTKNIKKAPPTIEEQAKTVLDWYNNLSTGETYTKEQAAEILDLTLDEITNSLAQIQPLVLPRNRTAITDWE